MCLQLKFYQLRPDETGDVTVSSNGHARPWAIRNMKTLTQYDFYPVPSKNLNSMFAVNGWFIQSRLHLFGNCYCSKLCQHNSCVANIADGCLMYYLSSHLRDHSLQSTHWLSCSIREPFSILYLGWLRKISNLWEFTVVNCG